MKNFYDLKKSIASRYPSKPVLGTLAICLLLAAPVSLRAADASGIMIISPAPNTTVRPGDSVRFQVEVDSSFLPAKLAIDGRGIGERFSGGPTYSGNVRIPMAATGPLNISMALIGTNGEGMISDGTTKITLNSIPNETPLSLDVNSSIYLDPRPSGGFYTDKLSIIGLYANDVQRNLSLAMLGTTYRSSDEAVVTVDINGNVQGVSMGAAYITVENHSVRDYIEIVVRGPNEAEPPSKDISSKVSITASGFRRDPNTRLYVQQLTIRNTSTEPIFWPITLVISELPVGVRLENSGTRTSVITPLNSGTADLDSNSGSGDGKPYAAPGETGTSRLEFSNRDGRPITHRVRLFYGNRL